GRARRVRHGLSNVRSTMPFCRPLSAAMSVFALALLADPVRGQAGDEERDQPHDLVLAVDVSLSMIGPWSHPTTGKRQAASDREGIRWDAIQFTLDVAREHDPIALVLYPPQNEIVTRLGDPSGFVRLDHKYPRFGNRTGREVLTDLIAQLHRLEERWAVDRANRLAMAKPPPLERPYLDFTLPLFAGGDGAKFT